MPEEQVYSIGRYPLGGNTWEIQHAPRPTKDMLDNLEKVSVRDNLIGVDAHSSYHVNVKAVSLWDAIKKGEKLITGM